MKKIIDAVVILIQSETYKSMSFWSMVYLSEKPCSFSY